MKYEGLYNGGKENDGQLILCSNCKTPTTFTHWLDRPGGYLQFVVCDHCGYEMKAGLDTNIDTHSRCVYEEACKCGEKLMVLTQPDRNPEYRSDVGVPCAKCQEIVWFSLPVN